MQNFLVFYAPFLVLIGSLVFAFCAALKDEPVQKNADQSSISK
ncbi:cytochrome bd oxidase small subunit CydS [Pueribacillus theae]|nr:hypothetical protein [Pueribacillus theae]